MFMDNNLSLESLENFLINKGIEKSELAPFFKQVKKDLNNKRYGIVWEDKEENVYKELLTKFPILKEIKEKEIKTDITQPTNLLIEGENLHSLKSLQYTHKEKIDVCYIDPPYNIGKGDFNYNNKYVEKEDTWRHSKWLSFMSKRLKLAKILLSDKGIIFISIDDNELYQLKLLCDEIFGEQNFVFNIVWKKGGGKSDAKYVSNKKEYLLCYKKNIDVEFNKKPSPINNYKLIDDNGKKYALRGFDMQGLRYSKSLDYPIECPDKTFIYPGKIYSKYIERQKGKFSSRDWTWTLSEKEFNDRKDKGNIVFKKQKDEWRVYYKSYYDGKESPFDDIYEEVGNQKGAMQIKELFNNDRIFNFPKPIEYIKFIINLIFDKNIIVLDFFAGSGTTGQAVIELNKEDNGNRQFILCNNNENNVCEDIMYQRLNKTINGYTTPKDKKVDGFGGNLKYYKVQLEEDLNDVDNNVNNLINKCTELISIKENCYDLVENNKDYDVIANKNKVILIYKNPFALNYEIKEVSNILLNYKHESKVLYATNLSGITSDIEYKEYPVGIIEQLKTLNNKY